MTRVPHPLLFVNLILDNLSDAQLLKFALASAVLLLSGLPGVLYVLLTGSFGLFSMLSGILVVIGLLSTHTAGERLYDRRMAHNQKSAL